MATLIFIPGHWNTPACYDALIESLLVYGYSSATVILPFEGCDAATYNFTEDATTIKKTLTDLAKIRRDVILVLHPAHRRSTARASGTKKHAARSLRTGVARMIFFMTYMSDEGFLASQRGERQVLADCAEFELEVSYSKHTTPAAHH
jgi:hypothetical protein